jgi:uncharacterized protein YbaP (TraB family)
MLNAGSGQAARGLLRLLLVAIGLLLAGWASAQPAASKPLVAATTARACPPPPDVLTPERIQQGVRNAQNRGPLWRITRDGQTSWLYGTAHVSSADWVFPGPEVVAALQQADVLALELNFLDVESLKPLIEPVEPGLIARVLDAPRAARVARQVALACLPPGALGNLRPAIQVATLVALDARHHGFYANFGIDAMLTGLAQSLKKPLLALESAQDQLNLLAGRNAQEERWLVDSALDALESGRARQKLPATMKMWAEADIKKLEDYPVWCDCMDSAEDRAFMKRLLDDRNVLMAEKINQLHASGKRVFAGVGVLHMVGAQGLPALMRANGFQVELVAPYVGAVVKP